MVAKKARKQGTTTTVRKPKVTRVAKSETPKPTKTQRAIDPLATGEAQIEARIVSPPEIVKLGNGDKLQLKAGNAVGTGLTNDDYDIAVATIGKANIVGSASDVPTYPGNDPKVKPAEVQAAEREQKDNTNRANETE